MRRGSGALLFDLVWRENDALRNRAFGLDLQGGSSLSYPSKNGVDFYCKSKKFNKNVERFCEQTQQVGPAARDWQVSKLANGGHRRRFNSRAGFSAETAVVV
jgi:hypothetical protein